MDDPATEILERLGAAIQTSAPAPGSLVRLGREASARRRRLRTSVAAAVLVAGVSGGFVARHAMLDGGPVDTLAAGTHLVTSPDEVVGTWEVVEVDGATPPEDAVPGLTLEPVRGKQVSAHWSDGVNTIGVSLMIGSDGAVRSGGGNSTMAACSYPSCQRPSGFGVREAAAIGLTDDGALVFLAEDGRELARYVRVHFAAS